MKKQMLYIFMSSFIYLNAENNNFLFATESFVVDDFYIQKTSKDNLCNRRSKHSHDVKKKKKPFFKPN